MALNQIKVVCRVHRDIEPIHSTQGIQYKIFIYGEYKLIGEKYFVFFVDDLSEISQIIDKSQIEGFRISYDQFDDYRWSSSGE